MEVDLLQAHDFCVSIAIRAGAYLRGQAASRAGLTGQPAAMLSATIKMSSVDIVTEADMEVGMMFWLHTEAQLNLSRQSERMISEAIRERYPDHQWAENDRPGWLEETSVDALHCQNHWRGKLLCWSREKIHVDRGTPTSTSRVGIGIDDASQAPTWVVDPLE